MQKTIDYKKNEVRNFVTQQISEKIGRLERFILFTQESSHDIKKTPKYDSLREEIQEEIYQMQRQLAALHALQRNMAKVLNHANDEVRLGSIVLTNKARFYISVSLGEFFFEGDRFYAISPQSPMAKIMAGKKAGDEFVLNNIHQKIMEIL